MLPFYISKRPNGYYRISFLDPETGLISKIKSSHSKDYATSVRIAKDWLFNGIPEERVNARKKGTPSLLKKSSSKIPDVSKITNEEALQLLKQLNARFGISVEENNSVRDDLSEKSNCEISDERKSCRKNNVSLPDPEKSVLTRKGRVGIYDRVLVDYLTSEWTAETSGYVQSRRAHGHGCTERHCMQMRHLIRNNVQPYFGNALVGDVDDIELDEFFIFLKLEKKLSASSINHVINAIKKPLDFAVQKGVLDFNPMEHIERFTSESKERGILEENEVTKLFDVNWNDKTSKLANFVAANAGLRIGEIQALRVCDIGIDSIHVMHNWSREDGLKCPKNGKTRNVPVPDILCTMLKNEARKNPLYSETSFIFFSRQNPEKPLVANVFQDALYATMKKIGISEQVRIERNIVFHSWRHYYATLLTNTVKLEQAQLALGHNSALMTKHYSDHVLQENFNCVKNAINERFIHQFDVTLASGF